MNKDEILTIYQDTKRRAREERKKYFSNPAKMLEFAQYYFPEVFNVPGSCELHQYLVDTAEEEFAVTHAPRGLAKSTIQSFLIPIWRALYKDTLDVPYIHNLVIMDTATKAETQNVDIRDQFENNERLIADFGDLTHRNGKWTEKQFILKNGVIFSALGVGTSIRGIKVKNKRPNYIICDDLYSEDCVNNFEKIQKVTAWFWSSLYPARAKQGKWKIHIVGTAVHKDDLLFTLSKDPGIVYRLFKLIIDEDKGLTIWPEFYSFEDALSDKAKMGTVIFNREMQNEPRDDSTSIIKDAWIDIVEELPRKEWKTIKAGCDPAIGENQGNDFTAMSAAYTDYEGHTYFVDSINEHLTFNNILDTGESFCSRFSVRRFILEAISGFKGLAQEFRRQKPRVPLKELTSVKNKLTRLENVSYKFENRKVHFVRSCRNLQEIINQLTNNYPKHDDLRDCIINVLEDDSAEVFVGVI